MKMLGAIILKIMLMTIIVKVAAENVNEKTIDICLHDDQIYYRDDSGYIESYKWILKADTCSSDPGILVLKFIGTTLAQDRDCMGFLQMLEFEMCHMKQSDCIVLSSNEYINTTAISILGCRNTQWMFRADLLPVEIQYNSNYIGSYHFRINIHYISNSDAATPTTAQMETTDEDETLSTSHSKTTDAEYTEETTRYPGPDTAHTSQHNFSIYQIVAMILGILLGVVLVLSMLLLYRNGILRRQLSVELSKHPTAMNSVCPTEQTIEHDLDNMYQYANEQAGAEIQVTTSTQNVGSEVEAMYSVVNKTAKRPNVETGHV